MLASLLCSLALPGKGVHTTVATLSCNSPFGAPHTGHPVAAQAGWGQTPVVFHRLRPMPCSLSQPTERDVARLSAQGANWELSYSDTCSCVWWQQSDQLECHQGLVLGQAGGAHTNKTGGLPGLSTCACRNTGPEGWEQGAVCMLTPTVVVLSLAPVTSTIYLLKIKCSESATCCRPRLAMVLHQLVCL